MCDVFEIILHADNDNRGRHAKVGHLCGGEPNLAIFFTKLLVFA